MRSFAVPAALRTFASTARGCWAVTGEIRATVATTPAAHRDLRLDLVTIGSFKTQYDRFKSALSPYQSRWLWHPQAERLDHLSNPREAGALILGRLVALDLLGLQPYPISQAFLRHSRCDAGADQRLRQVLHGFKDEFFALAHLEAVVGVDLLLQFPQLALRSIALGLTDPGRDVRRAFLPGEIGQGFLQATRL